MRRAALLGLVAVGCAAPAGHRPLATVSVSSAPLVEPPTPETPLPGEEVVFLAGYVVHLSGPASVHPRRAEALVGLTALLADVTDSFPLTSRPALRGTPIWLAERTDEGPLYHARDRAPAPALEGAIELPRIETFLGLASEGRIKLAPLLAGAWLASVRDVPWGDIEAAYAAAKAAHAKTADGEDNAFAYAARLSAAWFGRSERFPPDRAWLRAMDPRGTELVAGIWPPDVLPPKPPASEVDTRHAGAFTLLVERGVLAQADGRAAAEAARERLEAIAKLLPPEALGVVSRHPVVLRWEARPFNGGRGELWTHDGFVDLLNARAFLASTKNQPWSLLHEMGHVYAAARPEAWPAVADAYAKARAARLYERVRRDDGTWGRAYAATNAGEYFCELTTAYFARSSWFPFTREELATHDPDGYRAIAAAWR